MQNSVGGGGEWGNGFQVLANFHEYTLNIKSYFVTESINSYF